MKIAVLLLLLSLPAAAAELPPVTEARNAAAGYAVGTAGLADALTQVCGNVGEPVATDIASATAAWKERNGAIVVASLRWIEYGVSLERAAQGEASATQMSDGIKAAIRAEIMGTLQGIFPRGRADVTAEVCQEWAGALNSPETDLAANSRHGAVLNELRAIVWPAQ